LSLADRDRARGLVLTHRRPTADAACVGAAYLVKLALDNVEPAEYPDRLFRRHPNDYPSAVRLAANISGDSDSVASIAGGILGARLGTRAIPAEWVARLENREYLTDLADRLAANKAQMLAVAAQATAARVA
jgi:ADP-ribosylglycohydrolase